MYLVSANEMREMDRQTIEDFGIPGRVLMENAGRETTRILLERFPEIHHMHVGILAGRGNNGGDGFVIARYLAQNNIDVTVYLLTESGKVKGDAAANLELLPVLGVPIIEIPDKKAFSAHTTSIRHHGFWVDAILGTGIESDVRGHFKDIIEFINGLNKPVLSVDIPSGLNSDTGQICGACIRALTTVTFAFAKTGHFIYPGPELTGKLEIVEIGIPPFISEKVGPFRHLLTQEMIRNSFIPRSLDAHKGSTGHLLVLAGSPGKTGAAAMTAMSALRAGAGLVTVGIPKSLNPILEAQVLEAMTFPLAETIDGLLDVSSLDAILNLLIDKECLAIGPGVGTGTETEQLVRQVVQKSEKPLVIDADGLNNFTGYTDILKDIRVPVVLTPHPGEMTRLIDKPVRDIQKDRIGCARDAAVNLQAHVVLKGAGTVIAHPDGSVYVNPTGNSGMASGGMGDVLTGLIAGFITQGYSPASATHMGVYLHGAAADELAIIRGPFGFLATEVMNTIPDQINKIIPQ